jgi:hypothetical protein
LSPKRTYFLPLHSFFPYPSPLHPLYFSFVVLSFYSNQIDYAF